MYVTKEAIERVRRRHDLVALIESRGVKLRRKGRNFVGLCPFHEDREPSLVVNPERQLWNCFGACREKGVKSGGDVFTFVAKSDGVTFIEAMKRLGYEEPQAPARGGTRRRAGASSMKARPPAPHGNGQVKVNRPELLRRVVEHYHRTLRESAAGQKYLESRGLLDPPLLTAFEVGYADGSVVKTVAADGDVAGALKELGVLTPRGREHLEGCVVFPLTLPDVGVVGLYGRHVCGNRHLYLPGPHRGVFGWQAMKGTSEVIFTESVIDAVSLHRCGVGNAVALYGTQGYTADHEELLGRFRVRRVTLCLDGDEAGWKASEVIGERIARLGIEVASVRLEGAKDPNELLVKQGREEAAESLKKLLRETSPLTVKSTVKGKAVGARAQAPLRGEAAGPPSQLTAASAPPQGGTRELPFAGDAAPEAAPVQTERVPTPAAQRAVKGPPASRGAKPAVTREEGGTWRVGFCERAYRVRGLAAGGLDRLRVNLRVEQAGRVHLDTLDLYSHRARCALLTELAGLFEREEEELAREVASLIETLEGLRVEMSKKATVEASGTQIELSDRERDEALRMLRAPDLMERVLSDFERAGCVGEKTTLTVAYLGTVSRLLDDPLGLMIVSRSGAGKSSLQDAVCEFVPEEALVKYTRLTGQALFYKEEDSLVHKVLAVDEEKGAEEAAYSIRNLQSAQALSIAATRTDPQTGKLRTEEYRVRGPVFIMFTTTSPEAMDYETRNRFVQASVDESTEQTRAILTRQRESDTLEGVLRREEASFIRKKHHNVQRLLRPLRVVNPYAPALFYPEGRLQMRREQKKYLTLIKSIALLHQHQREIKRASRGDVAIDYIEVAPADIALANALARQVLGRSLDELAHPTRQLLRHLVGLTRGVEGRLFTRQDVRDATGWSDWQVRSHLAHLVDLEYVVVASGRNGKRLTYELLFEGDPEEDGRYLSGLVDVEELVERGVTAAGNNGGGVCSASAAAVVGAEGARPAGAATQRR